MSTLSAERCVACRRDSPRVTEAEIAEFRREVPDWQLLERDRIAMEHDLRAEPIADAERGGRKRRWIEAGRHRAIPGRLQLLGLAHSIKRLRFNRASSAWQLVRGPMRSERC